MGTSSRRENYGHYHTSSRASASTSSAAGRAEALTGKKTRRETVGVSRPPFSSGPRRIGGERREYKKGTLTESEGRAESRVIQRSCRGRRRCVRSRIFESRASGTCLAHFAIMTSPSRVDAGGLTTARSQHLVLHQWRCRHARRGRGHAGWLGPASALSRNCPASPCGVLRPPWLSTWARAWSRRDSPECPHIPGRATRDPKRCKDREPMLSTSSTACKMKLSRTAS